MKIVYIIDSLASKGGAERIISEKMNYLANLCDYDVSVITFYQFPEVAPNCYYLSDKVRQINLSIPSYLQYNFKYPKRLWVRWSCYNQLRKRLSETVNSITPHIIIGLGYSMADIVCKIKCKAAKIIESHEARLFTMSSLQFKQSSPLSKAYLKLYRNYYLHIIEKHADAVVTLTRRDAQEWRKAKRVEIIPNFSDMYISKLSDCESKRVIAVGRLEWQKGHDRLLDIWSIVSKTYPDWHLDIFGEGSLEMDLRNAIKKTNIKNVSIHPYTKNISIEYAHSSICVLTSRFEGFSLVLLEAMRHGLPCITFDCPYGPKELVDHEKSGFVIANNDKKQFADKLCYLIGHPTIRKQFANVGVNKALSYDINIIMNQWKELFNSLSSKKQ